LAFYEFHQLLLADYLFGSLEFRIWRDLMIHRHPKSDPWLHAGMRRHYVLRGHEDWINQIVWSSDGYILAASLDDTTIGLWDIKNRLQQCILKGNIDIVISLSFSSDGRFLASLSRDGSIRLWRANIWKGPLITTETSMEKEFSKNRGFANLAFHPRALVLATPCELNTAVQILDLDLGAL
jgi:WD40 repeat protein